MKLNNIKNTFEKREIKPSADSWDVLSARLDEDDKKSKKPVVIYWLSAIAAIFIAALLLYPSLNKDTVSKSDDRSIVNTIPESIDNNNKDVKIVEPQLESVENDNLASTVSAETQNNDKRINKSIENQAIVYNTTPVKTKEPVVKTQEIDLQNSASTTGINEPLVDSNDNTAMASLSTQPMIEKQLTAEEEMELLLNKAMGKVEVTEVAVKTVNPDKLLRETEWDIKSDNRSKLQNSIQGGLDFLRAEAVAIVDRNK
ncbi:hypothetical protein FNJ87_05680 [Nonlabens mediterrranea]|uniref:Anti-sigma factor n=1 Tax=Nonlabens mediterrranea TaxID=1419947 RepID=A0ABS0A3B0_9FLAO|nr:hypothetical protein BBFL7_01048 [Flavobacteria bacterium BBFL7]MBF4983845.1 hypothetical protein [Nonlabens mediterrranea]